ncbi:VCBS repeat-containing protein [Ochrobactrum intermedium]|uniref:VCBS repeat-containing protein n=1 Tax=Brucella intermedia TaxID=94625 RepID=A0ABR6AV41_9HYPH|nr:BapA/Bap/LapF family large adhesin [Brucella intermedia]MBA8853343.1 VCBS repeat-containing protein [Brucella intermedia]
MFDLYPRVTFSVEEGHSGDATVTVSASSLAGLFAGAQAQIQMMDESGNWVTMTNIGDNGILDLIWLGGNSAQIDIPDLGPGQYRVIGGASGVGIGTLLTVEADVQFYDHTTVGGYEPGTVTGNVMDENDTVTETTEVTQVNGIAVGGAGTTPIDGQYGTLTIDAEGNYSYTPNADGSGIGQVDVFEYTITDADGNTDTATLYVRIDSDGQGLVWPADPSLPAEIDMVANDDSGSADIDSDYRVEAGGPSGSGTAGISGGLSGTTATVTRMFTVDANDEASIRFVAGSPDEVLQSDTLTLVITGDNGYSQTLTGTSGFLSGLGVDQVLTGLPAGNYTVTATYARPGSSLLGGQLSLEFTGQSVTHLDEYVVANRDPATGNVLDGDTLGSTYTVFKIDTGGGAFEEVINSTVINGTYGTLTINNDGSYLYQPNSDLADIGGVDVFTYRLEHPNGAVSEATLTIDVQHGDGPFVPPVALSFFDEGEFNYDQFDDGNSDVDASSIEFPEPSLSDNFVLDDGEETDLSVSLEGFLGDAEQSENDSSFAGRDYQETETSPHTPALEGDVDPFAYLQTSSVDDPEQSLSTHQSVM